MRKRIFISLIISLTWLIGSSTFPIKAATLVITIDPNTYSGSGSVTDVTSSLVGTPTNLTFESGTNCGAFVFGGNSKIAFNQRDFGSSFSISAWVKPSGDPYSIQTIFSNAAANNYTTGFKVFWNGWNSYDHKMYVESGNGSTGGALASSAVQVTSDTWQHLAWTINASTGTITMYKNGSPVTVDAGSFSTGANMNQTWWIGAIGGSSYYMNARLGVVKIYSTILSSSEVTADYNSTSARYGATPSCPAPAAPSNSVAPSISGTSAYAGVLTAANGTWSGSPTGYSYQWISSSTSGGTYSNVSGATSQTYTLGTSDIGRYFKVTVTATNAGGSTAATSTYVGAVTQASQASVSYTKDVSAKTYPYSQVLNFTPTGGSGTGSWSYSISTGNTATNCQLSTNTSPATITADGSGICYITATKASDANYLSATTLSTAFTFSKATPTSLSISTTSGTYGTPLTLATAGGQSSASDTYTVNSGPCSISVQTLTASANGTCSVTAFRAADNYYVAASSSPTNITIAKGNPTVVVNAPATGAYRSPTSIGVSTGVAGVVKFQQNGKNIPGCISVKSNAGNSYQPTCIWKPSLHGTIKITAVFTPTDPSYNGARSLDVTSVLSSRGSTR